MPQSTIHKNKGFTLIEMLIVISIIALLASMILVGMGGARAKARDSRRIADIKNVQNALELYYSKYGFYPDVQVGLNDPDGWQDFSDILTDPEIGIGVSRIPKDPLSNVGQSYEYARSDDGQDYIIGAKLETKDPALDEDIDNDYPSNIDTYGLDCGSNTGDTIYCTKP